MSGKDCKREPGNYREKERARKGKRRYGTQQRSSINLTMSTLTNSLSGKQQQKKKFSIYSNLLSFLLGTAFAYLLLQPSCPATTTTSSTSKESSLKCNCEEILREKTADAAASNGDTISKEKNFYQIGKKYTTDKVAGEGRLPGCLAQPDTCTRKGCVKKECRAW